MIGLPNIKVAILAAGCASRFGGPKQLARIHGDSLLGMAVKAAKGVDIEPVVVLGAREQFIRDELDQELAGCRIVINADWEEGQSSSIVRAVDEIDSNGERVEGLLILLADQPTIEAKHLSALVRRFDCAENGLVATAYSDRIAVPAIFSKRYFSQLRSLKGDQGARTLLKQGHPATVKVDSAFVDIDTPEDLSEFCPSPQRKVPNSGDQ